MKSYIKLSQIFGLSFGCIRHNMYLLMNDSIHPNVVSLQYQMDEHSGSLYITMPGMAAFMCVYKCKVELSYHFDLSPRLVPVLSSLGKTFGDFTDSMQTVTL